jgi:hypothetical protein
MNSDEIGARRMVAQTPQLHRARMEFHKILQNMGSCAQEEHYGRSGAAGVQGR